MAGSQTRYLFVYALGDSECRTFFITEDLDPQDLKTLICTEFGLPVHEPVCFEHYDSAHQRSIIVPITAVKTFALSHRDYDIAVRLKSYSTPQPLQKTQPKSSNQQQTSGATYAGADPWENDRYFGEYAKVNIHWHMLKDTRRCEQYRKGVEAFAADFKDKIVLDVGCGTGILSCFAAKAGAKKVFAVEASGMHVHAREVAKKNGFGDVIEVIHGKIEDIELPVEHVDIIISEWMGIFLFFESMLDSVLFARDKWLAPDGQLFPAKARQYLAPLCLDDWWDERMNLFAKGVSGVDLSPLVETAAEQFSEFPLKGCPDVRPQHIVGTPLVMKEIDIRHCTLDEIRDYEFAANFDLTQYRNETEKPKDHIHGFVTWFDVTFESNRPESAEVDPVVLTTSPFEKIPTHWQQDCFLMGERIPITGVTEIPCSLKAFQHKQWRRHYEVSISFTIDCEQYSKEFVL